MKRTIKREEGQQSGIYKIVNLVNGKYYLGCTKNMASRYREHYSTLRRNKSNCRILQNAVNKYGIDKFEFIVVTICDNYKEQEIILLEQRFPDYNIIKETLIRREVSAESRRKMSEAGKGRPAYNKGKKRPSTFKVYKGKQIKVLENDKEVFKGTIKECANFMSLTALSNMYTALNDGRLINRKYKLLQI